MIVNDWYEFDNKYGEKKLKLKQIMGLNIPGYYMMQNPMKKKFQEIF